jgi:hypothetical protein
MNKRAALVSALLLAGLVVAVVSATAALRIIGTSAFGPGGKPLTQADVQRALAQQPPTTPAQPTPGHGSPSGKPSRHHPTPTSRPVSGSFSSSGGNVIARCLSGQVALTGWFPAQGYAVDGYLQGPAASAWVKFGTGTSEVTVTASCGAGAPRFSTAADDHGGGDDNGGGGSGRSPGGSGH